MTHLLSILADQNFVDRFFLPHPASNLSHGVDWAWNFILGITTFFFCIVVGVMIVCLIRFRRRTPNDATSKITHNTPLEIMWTVIPLILVFTIFFIGFRGFIDYDTPASNATPIDVLATRWKFQFTYPNGGVDGNLYLLKGVPYVLRLTSNDVLHGVYIPAFRTQRNAVPGRTTEIWFIPEETTPVALASTPAGYFDLFCTQYCGQNHSKMHANVYVYDDDADGKARYEKKMNEINNPFKETIDGKDHWKPYVKVGESLYNNYCISCHSIDGTKGTGPTWKGLYKNTVEFSESNVPGYTLSPTDSDEKWDDYLMESILHPAAKIVKTFGNQMTDFSSQFTSTDPAANEAKLEKVRALMAFIKSNGVTPYTPQYTPEKNPEMFIVDAAHPVHPESLAAERAKTQPAATTTAPPAPIAH